MTTRTTVPRPGLTLVDPCRARTAWFVVAVGTSTAGFAGQRSATAAARPPGATILGSGLSWPQVSELNGQSGAGEASEGRAKPACGAGVRMDERV